MFNFYTPVPLKTLENLCFSDVFRGCKNWTLVRNELIFGEFKEEKWVEMYPEFNGVVWVLIKYFWKGFFIQTYNYAFKLLFRERFVIQECKNPSHLIEFSKVLTFFKVKYESQYWVSEHCVKSVQIRSFLWSVFSCIRTRKSSVFGQN